MFDQVYVVVGSSVVCRSFMYELLQESERASKHLLIRKLNAECAGIRATARQKF